jgi:hypothetical protein
MVAGFIEIAETKESSVAEGGFGFSELKAPISASKRPLLV